MISTNTYLNFSGNCEGAFQFYEKTLGGKIVMTHRMLGGLFEDAQRNRENHVVSRIFPDYGN
jgi:uncharacterized glyoxalase superfamily protein PhnB